MTFPLWRILASLTTLFVAAHAHAFEAGWMQIQTPGRTPDAPTTTVALYSPTMAAPRVVAMGPFSLDLAIGGKSVEEVKALILLSHGNATLRGLPVQAAVRGQGVALVRAPFLQDAVASGDLVMPLPALRMPVGCRHVPVVDAASARRPEVDVFVHWLPGQAQAVPRLED